MECQGSGRPKDEDEEVLAKSRRTLEQKARLYEKLRRGEDDDVSEVVRENILVDFVRKDWDPVGKRFVADEPEQIVRVEKVEFVDEFGRTRLVTVEEHAALVKTKQELANKLIESLKAPTNDEAEEAIAGPAHYDDTQEIRSKGIGFYRFSQSESARQKQLAELNVLRQSTVESRSKAMILKEQRRIVQEARLAKVRERRLRQQQGKDGLHHKDAEEQT